MNAEITAKPEVNEPNNYDNQRRNIYEQTNERTNNF